MSYTTVPHNVTTLLTAAGYAPWLNYGGFSAAVWLANAVSQTIECPLKRAKFVADAAIELTELKPEPLAPLEQVAVGLAREAEEARSSWCGSTELWGSLVQHLAD